MKWQQLTSEWIAQSSIREIVLDLLMNVPGLPPIVQTVHIAAIAVIMASIVFVALRLLGIAVPGQRPEEMIKRLMPWVWWALLALLISGSVFVIARPDRYIYNPIAAWKLACLVPAIIVMLTLQLRTRTHADYWQQTVAKRRSAQALSVLLLILLTGVVLAGRWIAYVDYIYWE